MKDRNPISHAKQRSAAFVREARWLAGFVLALSLAHGVLDLWDPVRGLLAGGVGSSQVMAVIHLGAVSTALGLLHLALLAALLFALADGLGLLEYRIVFRSTVWLACVALLALCFAGVELYDGGSRLTAGWLALVGRHALMVSALAVGCAALARFLSGYLPRIALALAGVVALGLVLPWALPYRPLAARGAASADAPNVILYVIDTLRADHLGTYGYHRDTSPAIDALAETGLVFERAYVAYTASTPSHATIQTGCLPFRHGAISNGMRVRDEVTFVAEAFRDAGYTTGAFHNHLLLSQNHRFDQGFDTFVETHQPTLAGAGLSVLRAELHLLRIWDVFTRRQTVMPLALDWIDSAPAPFFLWITTAQPHAPYRPPADLLARFQEQPYNGPMNGRVNLSTDYAKVVSEADLAHMVDRYDAEVAWADQDVAKLIHHLESRGLRRRTVVVVTADHGEELGEHGQYFEHGALYEESVRVPLIVSFPGEIEPGRVGESVSLVDLGATLLRLAGVRSDPSFCNGNDLSVLWEEEGASWPPVVAWKQAKIAAMDEAWKLILPDIESRAPELYNLNEDPGERKNVASSHAAQRERLWEAIREVCRASAEVASYCERAKEIEPSRLDPDSVERLRALGYIE